MVGDALPTGPGRGASLLSAMAKKNRKALSEAYGPGDGGLPDIPAKVGNLRIARLLFARLRGGCSLCFPHGWETTNSNCSKKRRSWKLYRPKQYHHPDD